jgi:N-acetylglucosamine-6-sulfatase
MSQVGRRRLTAVLLIAAVALAVALALGDDGSSDATAGGRPNFVVIVTDDQTLESMRVMERVQKRIGERGTTFDTAYVNFALCCPSRATLLTGQYAHNHLVLGNKAPIGGFERFQTEHGSDNLATWMQAGGYRTVHVGKYFNGYGDDDPAFVPDGWDEWYASTTPGQRVYDYRLNENGTLVSYGSEIDDFKEDVLTRRAVEVIESQSGAEQPLYLSLAYTAPHDGGPNPSPQPPADCANAPKPPARYAESFDSEPLPAPPSFDEADVSDKPPSISRLAPLSAAAVEQLTRRYRCTLESLLAVDDGVGEIVAALRDAGTLDNTYVIFTSDNGLFFGEHRIPGGKVRHYEEASRVPLLIRGPGVRAGAAVKQPVINADLAPTILEAAGIAPGLEQDGVSLHGLLAGEDGGPDRDLLIETRTYAGIRTHRYVYVEHHKAADRGLTELYDVVADPGELDNLSADPAYEAIRARLAERLAALAVCAGERCSSKAASSG